MNLWRSRPFALSTALVAAVLATVGACSPAADTDPITSATDGDVTSVMTDVADVGDLSAMTDTQRADDVAAPATIATLPALSGELVEVEPGGPLVAVELVEAFKPMPARPAGAVAVDPEQQPPIEDFFVKVADVEVGIRAGMKVTWLDARDKMNFDFGHIPGSINAPYFEIGEHVASIPKDEWVIAYCECPHHESGEAAMGLWNEGYRYVKVLEEGLAGWRDGLGMPVESTPTQ